LTGPHLFIILILLIFSRGGRMSHRSFRRTVFLWTLAAWCFGFVRLGHAQDTLAWTAQASSVTQDLWCVHFADTLNGWAAGNNGTVVRTVNGGQTWTRCTFAGTDTIHAIFFTNPARGWMAGGRGIIYASADSGLTWGQQYSRTQTYFTAACFFDTLNGLFVGGGPSYDGTVVRTANGGQNWIATDYSTPWAFSSVSFINPQRGWAAGNDYVLPTSNGGQTWGIAIDPLASYRGYVNSICFVDTLKGFGVGRYGGITGTNNSGQSWFAIDTTSSAWLEDISFADPRHGVIVGERGVICWSADSGKTWQHGYPHHQPTLDAAWFRAVCFVDARHGWTVGDDGLILRGAFVGPTTGQRAAAARPAVAPPRMLFDRSGTVTIALTRSLSENAVLKVCRLDGTRIHREPVLPRAAQVKLDLSGQPAGIYAVAVMVAGRPLALRLVPRME
jgi:photosystem II stability/assembly factor-like uncharacterized protein